MNSACTKQPNMTKLKLFLSQNHDCGYLPDRQAATLFTDPTAPMNDMLYAFLMERGFRRSGRHVYRHHCHACGACTPVRIPVEDLSASRSLRRVWRRNQDLQVRILPAEPNQERFDLYRRYINHRHQDGPMSDPELDDFTEFLLAPWSTVWFVEFRKEGQLLMVAVTDILPLAFSAVYTFFEPAAAARSLGTYAILWQIHETRRLHKHHLYLGYWIDNCQKMYYKTRFQPLEMFRAQQWRRVGPKDDLLKIAPA